MDKQEYNYLLYLLLKLEEIVLNSARYQFLDRNKKAKIINSQVLGSSGSPNQPYEDWEVEINYSQPGSKKVIREFIEVKLEDILC